MERPIPLDPKNLPCLDSAWAQISTVIKTVAAIYEDGVLKLEAPLPLPDKSPVMVTVESESAVSEPAAHAFDHATLMNPMIETAFRGLTPTERLLLVEEIWNRIAAEPGSVPLSPGQRVELDRRLDALEKNPDPDRPWPEVRDELLRR